MSKFNPLPLTAPARDSEWLRRQHGLLPIGQLCADVWAARCGHFPDDYFAGAISKRTRRPTITKPGLLLAVPPGPPDLESVEVFLSCIAMYLEIHEETSGLPIISDRFIPPLEVLLAYTPTVDLWSSFGPWAHTANLLDIVEYAARKGSRLTLPPGYTYRESHITGSQLDARPKAARGPLTWAAALDFCTYFPALLAAVKQDLAWSGTGKRVTTEPIQASQVVSNLLGIQVDMRRGRLLSEAEIGETVTIAYGQIGPSEKINEFIDADIPWVDLANADPRLGEEIHGAMWSSDLEVALHGLESLDRYLVQRPRVPTLA
jgi:hypothetical protein